jgi:uncharacterized protein with NRDE domain
MCLVVVAHRASARFPLVLAANRDEDHTRPAVPAHWWSDAPQILGGRDALAGGTWLAMTRGGRFAAVTNLRFAAKANAPSRGLLVRGFLQSEASPFDYISSIELQEYAGFHLVAGTIGGELAYVTNAEAEARALPEGIHAFSNGTPDELWPKVDAGIVAMRAALGERDVIDALLRFLRTSHGRTPDREAFVLNERWGTRSSTVILAGEREVTFVEQLWTKSGADAGQRRFTFPLLARLADRPQL